MTPVGCPTIHFTSDIIYFGLASDPKVKVSVPQDCTTPHHVRCQLKVQVVICASDQLAKNWDSHDLLFGFDNLIEWHIDLRETHLLFIIKKIIKDTDE